ncbi:MAG: hypothetical protein J6D54_05975, partial [Olsenella sp.]|nr:hypothetical protein [Olsenella sp.]
MGEKVSPADVTEYLNCNLGFASIPISVTKVLLKRLSPTVLRKSHGEYYLKADLSEEMARFNEKRRSRNEQCKRVGEALSKHIESKVVGAKVDSDTALDCLLLFFESHGISIAEKPKTIN